MPESSEDTVYPTVWEIVRPADGIHHHAGRALRRRLSAYVWESRVVWPGDPLYPEPADPNARTPASALTATSISTPEPARSFVSGVRYVLPSNLYTPHPHRIQ